MVLSFTIQVKLVHDGYNLCLNNANSSSNSSNSSNSNRKTNGFNSYNNVSSSSSSSKYHCILKYKLW